MPAANANKSPVLVEAVTSDAVEETGATVVAAAAGVALVMVAPTVLGVLITIPSAGSTSS